MPPRSRPGPLQEIDLRLVLTSTGTPSHCRKRPHSPSVGLTDSPAKRRLKAEEGRNAPKLKSPLSTSSNSARFAPAHFHALLQGPDSPAKRLDFGSSEVSETTVCETPRSRRDGRGSPKRTTARVRRSPRLSSRAPSSSPEYEGSATNGSTGTTHSSDAARPSTAAPLTLAREVTPPDRQSIHYPGFDVYQDTHITIPMSSNVSSGEVPSPSTLDKELDKENIAPRRRVSKKAADPGTPSETGRYKTGLFSPSIKKHVPTSPHPKHVRDYLSAGTLATPKPRTAHPVVSPAATLVGATPGRTPLGKEERKMRRRALEEEVDDVDDEDDTVL